MEELKPMDNFSGGGVPRKYAFEKVLPIFKSSLPSEDDLTEKPKVKVVSKYVVDFDAVTILNKWCHAHIHEPAIS